MSDDEVSLHHLTSGRDGRWSAQTKGLLDHFKTDKLSLNAGWASTWTGWICPCCSKGKLEIARLTKQGVVLCELELHHDHLREAIDHIFRECGAKELESDNRHALAPARNAVHLLVERFEPTLICSDCNTAEGRMKAELGNMLPRDFSFSPIEIAKFVQAQPNSHPDINAATGRQIWEAVRADYESRVAFAEELANRILAGLHNKERPRLQSWKMELDDRDIIASLVRQTSDELLKPCGLGMDLRVRSCANDSHASSKLSKAKSASMKPTDGNFDAFDLSQTAHSAWSKAKISWKCATCERDKRQIMRKSNRGIWTATIHDLYDFFEEVDPSSIAHRRRGGVQATVLSGYRTYQVCQDCRLIETEALKISPKASTSCLSKEAIRRLVGAPVPNQRHEPQAEHLLLEARCSADWIAGVEDFWKHRDEATKAHSFLRIAETDPNIPPRQVPQAAFDRWRDKQFSSEWATVTHFNWLNREYLRLKKFGEE